ncbi:MAG TPA: COX15/CtaA family protein [Pseudomonadales bacterium]|jgi:cytochrome c oxidase assembly protein subunit 15|nr:COX15/CtaA family protein [Pseudomonadales bacterium]HNI37093.1 COX15/CtaA family protein [Pseudomonadales bacterium]HNL91678.1 COX15/CtaA family protein [Pseudomonadales bacterium]HNN86489.1 COX15/CtaA family protein [Pseudomonadales bacterium]
MQRKPGFYLAIFAFCVAVVVIVLGAYTRLVHAGLGCPDWPTCYSHFWVPTTPEEIHHANQNFSATPVQTDKTWPEQIHRIFASSLGVLVIGLLVIAIRNRKTKNQPLKLPAFMLGFVILQGLFGMWTVTLLLWPQVVTAHLLGGFTTLSLLCLLAQRLGGFVWMLKKEAWQKVVRLRGLALAGLLAVVMQIALGGWTTSNYAALACPDLPTCHGKWLPAMDFSAGFNVFQHIGPNYLGGQLDNAARTAIHFAHRVGAVVVTLLLLSLIVALWRTGIRECRRMSVVVSLVLLVQLTLGISNVVFGLPLFVAVSHNAVGALLLLIMVTLNHRVLTVQCHSSIEEK